MKLNEIASRDTVTLAPGDSIDKAIALMEEHNIRHLPVVDARGPVGIVSHRDLMATVGGLTSHDRVSPSKGPALIGPQRVEQVMNSPVHTLTPDDPIKHAARLMVREKISAAPLVRDGGIVGIVTETDLLKCFLSGRPIGHGSAWRFEKVADHMAANVFSLEPHDTPQKALKLMHEKRIRHVPVVLNGKPIGIVSDRDVSKCLFQDEVQRLEETDARYGLMHRTELEEIMSAAVETVGPSGTLIDAADRMIGSKIGALPVVCEGKLVGIITETTLLRALVAACDD